MSVQTIQDSIDRLVTIQTAPPDHDGTFILITYQEYGWSEEVTVTLETQADGSVVATCSTYDEPGIFESYADAWYHFADSEVSRLSAELDLQEMAASN